MSSGWVSLNARQTEPPRNLKRSRAEEANDSDDNLDDGHSRSASPNGMHVDDYEKEEAPQREVITVETKLKPTNMGFAMLQKLGWSEGTPLGLSSEGRTEPVPIQFKQDHTGLGKTKQDVRMIETTVSQRRNLDSERQQKETEDQRRAREDIAARRSALQEEIIDSLKAFYCTLCDKQFKNVGQYDEHTNSYAHHHKARYRDMQANARMQAPEELDKRKEKERKREEKELRKIAAANGIKMAKTSTSILPATVEASSSKLVIASDSQSGFRQAAWTSVGDTSTDSTPPSVQPSGWTSLDRTPGFSQSGIAAPPPPQPAPPPPPEEVSLPVPTVQTDQPARSGWQQFQKKSSSKRR